MDSFCIFRFALLQNPNPESWKSALRLGLPIRPGTPGGNTSTRGKHKHKSVVSEEEGLGEISPGRCASDCTIRGGRLRELLGGNGLYIYNLIIIYTIYIYIWLFPQREFLRFRLGLWNPRRNAWGNFPHAFRSGYLRFLEMGN